MQSNLQSPTLSNMYNKELAVQMDQCTAPCLYIRDREVKSLFYADDLGLLSAVGREIQQTAEH